MAERDPAAGRFLMLQIVRLGGVLMVVIGAMMLAGTLDAPDAVGFALMVMGVVEFFVLPLLLARMWRSGDEEA